MSYEYSEDALIEQATEDVLKELGWKVVTAWQNESFGEHGLLGRDNKTEVVLERFVLLCNGFIRFLLHQFLNRSGISQIRQTRIQSF